MGLYLSKPNTTKLSFSGKTDLVSFMVSSMQGWRRVMEDSYLVTPNIKPGVSVFALFDGHGGPEVAKFCAYYFSIELQKNINFIENEYKKALEETFLKMDSILLTSEGIKLLKSFKNNNSDSSNSGSSALVILITETEIFVANAGDSRAYLSSKNNELTCLSVDHSPNLPKEKARIKLAGGYVSEGRVNDSLKMSRAIGDLQFKKNEKLNLKEQIITSFPDIISKKIDPGFDVLMIGSDGIWETLSPEEIFKFIKGKINKEDQSKIVEDLLDKLLAKDTTEGIGCDNMTCFVIEFQNERPH